MKQLLLFLFVTASSFANAQKIESIHVDLYTDSLKKGTYNYINIDGKLPDGNYIPLDSTDIIFSSDNGKFFGNSLWVDPGFSKEKINIKAVLLSNPELYKEFTIYIKKIPNPDQLPSLNQVLDKKNIPKKKK
ncbi:MAG: hypothetical protein Q8891_14575 [Bacteroidota bacterium]|nr:hypothetical protein [Bacteroidota bacterium]